MDHVAADFAGVQDQLKKALPNLTRAQRQAAAHLLDQPGQVATLPVRRLAEIVGVGAPNFDRLAKAIGFQTFGELREIYRRHVQTGDRGNYHLRAGSLLSAGKADGITALWDSFRAANLAGIERIYREISPDGITGIANRIAAQRTVFVCGFEASRAPASYLAYLGAMVSPAFHLLGRGGGVHCEDLVDAGPQDALIAVALSPCAASTIEAARIAAARGAYVLGVTDSLASPLAQISDEVLITPTESPLFFDSYIGTMAISELLVGALTLRMGDAAVDRIAEIEALRIRMKEYWT